MPLVHVIDCYLYLSHCQCIVTLVLQQMKKSGKTSGSFNANGSIKKSIKTSISMNAGGGGGANGGRKQSVELPKAPARSSIKKPTGDKKASVQFKIDGK